MFDIEKARQAEELAAQCLSDLCHARRRWEMHIPLQSDDPDVLLGDALGQLRGAIKEVEQQRQLAEAAEKRLVQAEWGDVGFCPHCHADELRSSDDEYNDEQHLYVTVYRCGACGAMWAGDIKQGIDLAKQLAAATARAEAAEGEASSAMETTKLTQEKLHDALNSIQGLTRERDEALDIAERTHTDMHAVRSELERQRQRADAVEWEADGQCGHCGEDAVRVSIDTAGYPHEVYAVRYCPVCHSAWVREEPVNPDASQM